MPTADDAFIRELEARIDCYEFLLGFRMQEVAPYLDFLDFRTELSVDGEIFVIHHYDGFPSMESTWYSSLEQLLTDLMAGVAYYFSASTMSAKQKIAAKMLVAIRRHRSLIEEALMDGTVVDAVECRILGIVSGELSSSDGSKVEELPFECCREGIEELRELAESLGYPDLMISTPFYHPISHIWREMDDGVSTNPIVEGITPVRRACGPAGDTADARPLKKSKRPSPNVRGWYETHQYQNLESGSAVTAIVKRLFQLQDAGVLTYEPVSELPAKCSVQVDDGRPPVHVFVSSRGWWLDEAEYHSLDALLIDIMVAVCWLLSAPGEFQKRYRLAILLQCLVRHWPLQNPKLESFFEDIASWLWKLLDVPSLNLGDRDQTKEYLLLCDEYLADFDEFFISRTTIQRPVLVWTQTYLPPGTAWRKFVMEAIERSDGTDWVPLAENPSLCTTNFIVLGRVRDLVPGILSKDSQKGNWPLAPSSRNSALDNGNRRKIPPVTPQPMQAENEAARTDGGSLAGDPISTTDSCASSEAADGGKRKAKNEESQKKEKHPVDAGRAPDEAREKPEIPTNENQSVKSDTSKVAPRSVFTPQTEVSRQATLEICTVAPGESVVEEDSLVLKNVTRNEEAVRIVELSVSPYSEDGDEPMTEPVESQEGLQAEEEEVESKNSEEEEEENEADERKVSCSGGSEDRRRELDQILCGDYRERMRRVQQLVGQFRVKFPSESKHFDLLDGHIDDLRQSLNPVKLTGIVEKMVCERCIENVKKVLEGFLWKFSAFVDASVKEDLEMCVVALGKVLNDSRMLLDFHGWYDKKRR